MEENSNEMMNSSSSMEDNSSSQAAMPKQSETDSGLDPNIAAAISYIFIVGLIFIFMEKKSKFVRFHAFQAVFFGVAWFVINFVLGIIPVIGWILLPLTSLALLVVWVYTIYKAYSGEMFKLPVIGDMAMQQAER